jgi:hypothetical protein
VADSPPSNGDVLAALDRLGLHQGASFDAVRAAYRRELRRHHPDIAGADAAAHARTARLIEAYQVLVAFVDHFATTTITVPADRGDDRADEREAEEPAATPGAPSPSATHVRPGAVGAAGEPYDLIDAQALDEDTIAVAAPAPETYAALYEAASRIGEIAYDDRQLGILETIVRFEGGPSCSVVMTLQGRAHHTEVFCTMESIEAAPTPPIRSVIDALVEQLENL